VPGKCTHLVFIASVHDYESEEILHALAGMSPDSPNDGTKKPMAGACVRTRKGESGNEGRVSASTYGGLGDLVNDGFRRMPVNACFRAAGLESSIQPDLKTDIVGLYRPTWIGVNKRAGSVGHGALAGCDTPVLPAP